MAMQFSFEALLESEMHKVGPFEGEVDGVALGLADGVDEGDAVGAKEVGDAVGATEGDDVVGLSVGYFEGEGVVGLFVGDVDGLLLGNKVGLDDGAAVGDTDGDILGAAVRGHLRQ